MLLLFLKYKNLKLKLFHSFDNFEIFILFTFSELDSLSSYYNYSKCVVPLVYISLQFLPPGDSNSPGYVSKLLFAEKSQIGK